jgi:hypothetical protein
VYIFPRLFSCTSAHVILHDFSRCYGFENWSTTGEEHTKRLLQSIILEKEEPIWTYERGNKTKMQENT